MISSKAKIETDAQYNITRDSSNPIELRKQYLDVAALGLVATLLTPVLKLTGLDISWEITGTLSLLGLTVFALADTTAQHLVNQRGVLDIFKKK